MSYLHYESTCPCGAKVKNRIKKPTYFTNSMSKVICPQCESRFLMTCIRDKERKDERIFTTHFEELELTDKALTVLKGKASIKVKSALDKVGLLPEVKPSKIESNLDEAG